MTGLQKFIADWPWTATVVAVTLALTTFYIVGPFILTYKEKPVPSDYVMDLQRTLLTIMWPSVIALVVGKRATTKVEVMRFDAEQRGGES